MPDPRTNGAYSTVATAPSPATSGTTLVLATGDGARFPTGSFNVVVCATGQRPIFVTGSTGVNAEIVRATRTAGSDSLAIVRAQEGTTARTIVTGDDVFQAPTNMHVEDLQGLPTPYGRGAGLINLFDRIRGAYNFKSSNTRKIDQGLGRCMAGGMAEHVWYGDSISAGCLSSLVTNLFDRINSVPMSMRNALANGGIPANGTGLVRCTDSTSFSDSRWTFTGTWSNQGGYGYSTAAASTAVFAPDKSGTMIDILYYDYASSTGQFTVKVDNGSTLLTLNVTGTNPLTGTGWKIARISGANVIGGFSNITITVVAPGTSGVFLAGCEVWTPNAGLRLHNIAQSGSQASGTGQAAWVDTTAGSGLGSIYQPSTGLGGGPARQVTDAASTSGSNTMTSATGAFTNADLYKPIDITPGSGGPMFPANAYISAINSSTSVNLSYMVNGVQTNANAYATLTSQTVKIGRDPDCVHIELGANDLNNGVTLSTITSAIQTIRNRYPNSDCLLHLPVEFSTAFVSSANEQAFETAIMQMADSLDVAIIDWRDQVGSYATGIAYGWYGDQNAHQQASTYMMIGASMSALIGPGAGRNQIQIAPLYDNDVVPLWYINRRRAITATATATTTAESIIMQLKVEPNTLKVGSLIRYGCGLFPAATTITTTRLRIGTAGTTSDAAVVVMSATAATNTASRLIQGNASVQAIGASGTFLGIGTEQIGAISAAGTATATSGTFDTTKPLYISLTVTNGTSTTTTAKTGYLELLP